jgi:serine/threonine-protein kinase RsbW
MDWLIDADDPHSIEQALSQIGSHLQRHAAVDEDVDGCLQALRAEIARLTPPGPGSLVRVHLDWRGKLPRAWFGAVADPEVAAKADLRPGESVPAAHRADLDAVTEDLSANLTLDVERRVQDTFEAGIPPMAHVEADPRRDGPLSVAVALAAAAETHPTVNPAQMATLAGTALADSIAATDEPHDAGSVARLWMEAHEALGSEAQVLSTDEGRLELAVTRGPFGEGVSGAQSLCHVSTGLAGRLGARVNGTAVVTLEKAIAAGDHECHLHLWLDAPPDEVRGERHDWPPSAGNPSGPAPNLDLSLNLPRESGSVPVVRRLAAQALRAFGVDDDDIYDVQLAISEACGNVIDHAADTDTYEVKVELAVDRCAITVVDQGGGFDATSIPGEAELSAEAGRGVALMRALVDNLAFRSEPQVGAVVHMVKSLEYDPSHPLWRRTPD